MRPCVLGDGFPLNDTRATLSMYCVDNLNVTLTGDFFADQFQWLKLVLNPCVNSATNQCKSAADVAAFFQKTPVMQFMYIDHYVDVTDYVVLVKKYRNEEKFFLVDVAQTKTNTLWVRS